MEPSDALNRLRFLEAAEALKDVERSGFTAQGRPEDSAAHTWRLCLWVLAFEDQMPALDALRLLKICILHDLGEAISGDVPAPLQTGDKSASERADFKTLIAPLPQDQQDKFLALWDDYETGSSPEAQMAKGLDKLETILQHAQGANPKDFDYAFNLDYACAATDRAPLLQALRALVDQKTRDRMAAGDLTTR